MKATLLFLENYEIWIYILLGGIALFCLRNVLSAWQEWRNAVFGLEKENAQRSFSSSASLLALITLLAFAEFSLVTFVSPNLPSAQSLATPTLNLLATSTVTLAPGAPTLTPPPLGTLAISSSIKADGCSKGQLEWSSPTDGQEVQGSIDLNGIINVTNMGFYKYQFTTAGSDQWTTIAAGDKAVTDNTVKFGVWNTSQLTPGDYNLRLVAVDNANNELPACEISVHVIAP
jgi:hypothetical protein